MTPTHAPLAAGDAFESFTIRAIPELGEPVFSVPGNGRAFNAIPIER